MKKGMGFKIIGFILAVFCVINSASAAPQQRASYTRRVSKIVKVSVPEFKGKFNTYDRFTVNMEISSNISCNYATGEIINYSTPTCTIIDDYNPERLVTASIGGPEYEISDDRYSLVVTGFPVLTITYKGGELPGYPVGSPVYENNTYYGDEFSLSFIPQ